MRIRMRFTKSGRLIYIGHLDTMRYFQKLMRRASIPIAYSNGMSPHQIMSFALPLGIGDESIGEYADIELTESVTSEDALKRLSKSGAQGIEILSFKALPDHAKNAMASVEAADYEIRLCDINSDDLGSSFHDFMEQNEIIVCKQTKKSTAMIDIRPFIFQYRIENDLITLRLKCGSVDNTKPELVMKAFFGFLDMPFEDHMIKVKRLDLLTMIDDRFVSLDDIGLEI